MEPRQSKTEKGGAEVSDETERLVGRYAMKLLPAVVVAGAALTYAVSDLGTAILVLAFGVLVGAVGIFWASMRTLSGEVPLTLEDALAVASPTAAEEQKRAVLQALRDLEFEKKIGKINDADYEVLLQRYRSEAKRLLKILDEDAAPQRARAEAYLAERMHGRRAGTEDRRRCASCSTHNDSDAGFCKKCGKSLDPVEGPHRATA